MYYVSVKWLAKFSQTVTKKETFIYYCDSLDDAEGVFTDHLVENKVIKQPSKHNATFVDHKDQRVMQIKIESLDNKNPANIDKTTCYAVMYNSDPRITKAAVLTHFKTTDDLRNYVIKKQITTDPSLNWHQHRSRTFFLNTRGEVQYILKLDNLDL